MWCVLNCKESYRYGPKLTQLLFKSCDIESDTSFFDKTIGKNFTAKSIANNNSIRVNINPSNTSSKENIGYSKIMRLSLGGISRDFKQELQEISIVWRKRKCSDFVRDYAGLIPARALALVAARSDNVKANRLIKVMAEPLEIVNDLKYLGQTDTLELTSDEVTSIKQGLQLPSGRDEGYGWVVVLAAFTINAIVAGYMKSFGIIIAPIKEKFPDTTTTEAGLMMGLLNGCRGILAPVTGAFSVMVGHRLCTIIGSILTATGLLLAIPGISPLYLAFTIGALVGIGICMCETPAYLITSEYFIEKRSTANGLRTAGNAFGGIVTPFLAVFLLEHQPYQGYFIIFAGIMLQMCILGMLYRPFEVHQQITRLQFLRHSRTRTDKHNDESDLLMELPQTKEKEKKRPLNLSLLKNPAYFMYIIMILLCNIAIPNVLMYLPLFGRYKNVTEFENSIIISVLSSLDFFCRMFLGWLSDRKLYKKHHAFVFGMAIAGTSLMMLPLAYNMWTILSILWMRSFGIAMFWALLNGLLADQFGAENMSTTWGFVRMTQGITNFFYPPLLGALADSTGSMSAPFLLMGAMQLLGAIVFALQPLVVRLTGSDVVIT
ncbi:monocarboxylate transporter 2-like [Palaemon carinicauda]|uniref:monocarboxylate transporter 2-like n=1 Tax=Palaemon carinicauda TaxID=392227 RepID=UPI0035B69FC2